jgi:hypothetical protein
MITDKTLTYWVFGEDLARGYVNQFELTKHSITRGLSVSRPNQRTLGSETDQEKGLQSSPRRKIARKANLVELLYVIVIVVS